MLACTEPVDRPGCPTPSKKPHTTRALAKQHQTRLRRSKGDKVRPYECGCGYWHVGHLPRAVLTGHTTAGEHYDRKAKPHAA